MTKESSMLKIRIYEDRDWKRLCEIHDAARMDELRGSVDLAAFLTLEETAENEGLFDDELYVAVSEKQVVGFVAFSSDEINWLYTDPNHYKKGIGNALLNFALERCEDKVEVSVLSGNKPAIQLYLKAGFKIIEKKTGKLVGNEAFDAEGFIMEWRR